MQTVAVERKNLHLHILVYIYVQSTEYISSVSQCSYSVLRRGMQLALLCSQPSVYIFLAFSRGCWYKYVVRV